MKNKNTNNSSKKSRLSGYFRATSHQKNSNIDVVDEICDSVINRRRDTEIKESLPPEPVRKEKPAAKHEKIKIKRRVSSHAAADRELQTDIYTEAIRRQKKFRLKKQKSITDNGIAGKETYDNIYPPGDERAEEGPFSDSEIPEVYVSPEQPSKENKKEIQNAVENDTEPADETLGRRLAAYIRSFHSDFLILPAVFIYLQLILQIYMKYDLMYMLISLFFCFSFGALFSILTNFFSEKTNRLMLRLVTGAACLFYMAETVSKTFFSYYFVPGGTFAGGKRITDLILPSLTSNAGGIILFSVPFFVVVFITGKKRIYSKKDIHLLPLLVVTAFLSQTAGFMATNVCTNDRVSEVYHTAGDRDEKAEYFGIFKMLSLDLKHTVFGAEADTEIDEDALSVIRGLSKSGAGEKNILDIDLEELSTLTSDKKLKWLDAYYNAVQPSEKNEYTGLFEGCDLIYISAESFTGYMIDKELTPTLYKLSQEGFKFNNFYTPVYEGGTGAGECMNMLGLYPTENKKDIFETAGDKSLYFPFTLANLLNKEGYDSKAFTYNKSLGTYENTVRKAGYTLLEDKTFDLDDHTFPQSDLTLINNTIELYSDKDAFNIYYLSSSGSRPYNTEMNYITSENYSRVADLPYSEKTRGYLAANLELEDALAKLLKILEEEGRLDKTVIAVVPDSLPFLDLDVIEELADKDFGSTEFTSSVLEGVTDREAYKNRCLIWSASMEKSVEVDKVCSQTDILPTLLNFFGTQYDSRFLDGRDVLSDSEGFVRFSDGSWLTDKGYYDAGTKSFEGSTGTENGADEDYILAHNIKAEYLVRSSEFIRTTNYFTHVFPEGLSFTEEEKKTAVS